MDNNLKTIVLFGGSGGVGTSITPLLKQKYNVISLSSDDVDVTKFEEVKDFFENNDVDIVVNLAGINYDLFLSKIWEGDLGNIKQVLDTNINGHVNVLANCLPKMAEKNYGRVIGISSVCADINVPMTGIYSTTKAAIDKLYQMANKENIRYRITCNTIQLGYWEVGMTPDQISPEYQEKIKKSIGLRRYGNAHELYNAIDFIINTEYYCGNNMKLNGGL